LSGIENVYFFGALLGLRPREIALHVDEIVAFAELEAAIDRQVKFYSSGMQMRLGFSVASFLDPAVLLVDEVLAVGDSAFQQRCLERMRDLLGAGTTLVFVSHDLAAVEATCSRALWLHDGRVQADGPTHDVLHEYREALEQGSVSDTSGPVVLSRASVTGADRSPVRSDGPATVELAIECHRATWGLVCIGVSEDPAAPIFVLRRDLPLDQGAAVVRCSIEHVPLPGGSYWLWVGMFDRSGTALMAWHPASRFDVAGPALDVAPPAIVRRAPVYVAASWTVG
jgi:ABC-2 type transport system ATP-binding protein